MYKKLLATLLATVLIGTTIIGCSNQTSSNSGSNNSTTGETSKSSEQEQVTLSVISFMKFSESVIADFEKEYPHIKVQYENFPGSEQYNDVFRARLAGGENLDIITFMPENAKRMVDDGQLVDLTGESWLDNFIDPLYEIQRRRLGTDKVYYVGYENVVDGVWYNKDIFDELGLQVPRNHDEMVAVSQTLLDNGITPMVNGFKDLWVNNFLLYPMQYEVGRRDGIAEDLASGELKWNEDEGFLAAMQRVEELVQFHDPNSIGLSYDQAFQAFLSGRAAMWAMGSWATELIQDPSSFEAPFTIGVMVGPDAPATAEKSTVTVATDTRCIGIYSKSKNVDAAKKFLEFYSRAENAQIHADETATMSNIKGVQPSGLLLDKWSVLVDEGYPTDEWTARFDPSVLLVMEQGAQGIFVGQKTAQEVLDDCQKQQEIINNR